MANSSIEKVIDYSGKVYCVTVPENIIYIRRNGVPVWCGNSLRFYIDNYEDVAEEIVQSAEDKSEVTCEACGKPGKLYTDGWWVTVCDEHRK